MARIYLDPVYAPGLPDAFRQELGLWDGAMRRAGDSLAEASPSPTRLRELAARFAGDGFNHTAAVHNALADRLERDPRLEVLMCMRSSTDDETVRRMCTELIAAIERAHGRAV